MYDECECGCRGHHHHHHHGCCCGEGRAYGWHEGRGGQWHGRWHGGSHGGHGEDECGERRAGPGEHHRGYEHHGGHGTGFHRRFVTRAERAAELEDYLGRLREEIEGAKGYVEELEAEARAVEEEITGLKTA